MLIAPFDGGGVREDVRQLARIAQQCAHLVLDLADHALGIDRQPAALVGPAARCSAAGRRAGAEWHPGSRRAPRRGPTRGATSDAGIRVSPRWMYRANPRPQSLTVGHHGGAALGAMRRDDIGEDLGGGVVVATSRQLDERRARNDALEQCRTIVVLERANHATTAERLHDFARPPLVARPLHHLEHDRLGPSTPEGDQRAVGLDPTSRSRRSNAEPPEPRGRGPRSTFRRQAEALGIVAESASSSLAAK